MLVSPWALSNMKSMTPNGQRPHGMESALDFQLKRLAAAKRADASGKEFRLNT